MGVYYVYELYDESGKYAGYFLEREFEQMLKFIATNKERQGEALTYKRVARQETETRAYFG